MQVQPSSTVPIFQQIADGVRSAVAAGVYQPGDLIPSVRVQALRLVVNPNTVQRAYEQLEREGLIVSRKGTGMVVADDSRSAANNGVEEGVRAGFTQTIAAARAAGWSRAAVDRVYRQCWADAEKRGQNT